jgi:hypothetical protein
MLAVVSGRATVESFWSAMQANDWTVQPHILPRAA